jgi:hypothetical protein
MSADKDTKTTAPTATPPADQTNTEVKAVELTAADAAKMVGRTVVIPPEKEGGKPITKLVPIAENEVLDFKDYGDHVVVVTTDGQKFTGDKKFIGNTK